MFRTEADVILVRTESVRGVEARQPRPSSEARAQAWLASRPPPAPHEWYQMTYRAGMSHGMRRAMGAAKWSFGRPVSEPPALLPAVVARTGLAEEYRTIGREPRWSRQCGRLITSASDCPPLRRGQFGVSGVSPVSAQVGQRWNPLQVGLRAAGEITRLDRPAVHAISSTGTISDVSNQSRPRRRTPRQLARRSRSATHDLLSLEERRRGTK